MPRNLASRAPGSFISFSEGSRACIGQRFAQVEFCAAIAVIFSKYSVELVPEHPMANETRRAMWEKARDKAGQCLTEGVEFVMALKMREEVPLALVKRGEEKWRDL